MMRPLCAYNLPCMDIVTASLFARCEGPRSCARCPAWRVPRRAVSRTHVRTHERTIIAHIMTGNLPSRFTCCTNKQLYGCVIVVGVHTLNCTYSITFCAEKDAQRVRWKWIRISSSTIFRGGVGEKYDYYIIISVQIVPTDARSLCVLIKLSVERYANMNQCSILYCDHIRSKIDDNHTTKTLCQKHTPDYGHHFGSISVPNYAHTTYKPNTTPLRNCDQLMSGCPLLSISTLCGFWCRRYQCAIMAPSWTNIRTSAQHSDA